VFARVVDEFVDGGLGTVEVVPILVSVALVQMKESKDIQIHVYLGQLQSDLGVLINLCGPQAFVESS